jgi:magnesium transporter
VQAAFRAFTRMARYTPFAQDMLTETIDPQLRTWPARTRRSWRGPHHACDPVRDRDRRGPGRRAAESRPLTGPTAHLFDADGHDGPVELTGDVAKSLGSKRLLWVDIDRAATGAESALSTVGEVLGVRSDDRPPADTDFGRARLATTADRIHLTVEALDPDGDEPGRLVRREIDLIAAPNVVVTIHEGESAALERYRSSLGETRLGLLTAGDLLSSLVDEVLDGYFLLAEKIEREIDKLDQRALHDRRGDDILAHIVALRSRIGLVRRTLAPHRHALSTLARPEMEVVETVGRPWPGLVDRVEAAMDAVEGLRDGLIGTFDIHMGRVSQRANDVMRTLTLLSAVLLPAIVLAGIMGMNFQLQFFETTANFWLVMIAMAALAAAIVLVARWRHWL